jgi:acyl-coenzyme A synthetase/AMP-(fatty) acid ligase
MSRKDVLAERVPPYTQRKAKIESETLPCNVGALLDFAADGNEQSAALHFFEQSNDPLTYGQLLAKVNRLANGLAQRGVRRGTHVAVMLPNIEEFPVTWLAIARLGAVMIPINVSYTARELAYVLEDGDAEFLVIHHDQLGRWHEVVQTSTRIPDSNVFVVDARTPGLASWEELLEGQSSHFEGEEAHIDDLLNIQYTSGTTGFPKGCMLTQRYWLTSGKQNAFRDGRVYRRVLASTPFFYMDPQWLMLMAFYRRGTLFVARRQSASRFMDWVRAHRIQFTLMPDVVLKQPECAEDRANELIRVNVYGLSKENHKALEERFDVCAREAYGMTEIGTGLFMPIEEVGMVGSGSCGVPAPFREACIADDQGQPVPDGQVGELLIRGPGIMRGYYKKEEANASAFLNGWFRTGDLFRRDARGYFYIVGRKKDMIRRAGENIAAYEVESILVALPEIAEAAVIPVKDESRGEEAKAYLVLKPGIEESDVLARVIEHCQQNLAAFKVPRYFSFRDRFVKTASGKISKPALVAEAADLRAGSYDRVSGTWVHASP